MRVWCLLAGVVVAGCAPTGGADAGRQDSGVVDSGTDAGTDAGVRDAGTFDAGGPCDDFVITPPSSLHFLRGEPASRAFGPINVQFEVASGDLPPGMTVDELGVLSGTPTVAGLYQFGLVARSARCVANLEVVVTIDCPLIVVTPPTDSSVMLLDSYTGQFTQTGAIAPVFFATDGEVPSWATLSSDGTFATESAYKTADTFRVSVQDFDGCTGSSEPFALSVQCPSPRITVSTAMPAGVSRTWLEVSRDTLFQRGVSLTTRFGITGFVPATFSIVDGGLPPGVSFVNKVMSGAPLVIPPGDGRFVVRAEFGGCVVEREIRPLLCEYINQTESASWTSANYAIENSPEALGWVNGTSAYHDAQKANFFDLSATDYAFIDDVRIGFGAASATNSQASTEVFLYDGTTGVPSSLIASDAQPLSMAQVDVDNGALSGFFRANTLNPLPGSKQFFVGVGLDQFVVDGGTGTPRMAASFSSVAPMTDAGTDMLAILSNSHGETIPSAIWERHADGGWAHYGADDSWNLNASLMIFPNVCK